MAGERFEPEATGDAAPVVMFHCEVWFATGYGYTRKFSDTDRERVRRACLRYTSDATGVRLVDANGTVLEQVKAESGLR